MRHYDANLVLPVIACAIDKQLILSAEKNTTESFYILMPDIALERIIPINEYHHKKGTTSRLSPINN